MAPWPGRDLLDHWDPLTDLDKAGRGLFLGEDFTSYKLLLGEYLSNKSLLCNNFTLTTLLLDMSLSSADPVDTPPCPLLWPPRCIDGDEDEDVVL